MSTMYLAFWAEPRGFTDLRACIHTASNQELPDEEEKREQLLDLLESLKDLDDYFQGLKFQYLRSRVRFSAHHFACSSFIYSPENRIRNLCVCL